MAIYRLEARIIGRGKTGRSVVAASAYRAGEKLYGEREQKTHDYSRRSRGVVATAVLAPDDAPSWATDLAALWNRVEAAEKRVDAQLAREFVLAAPVELSTEEQLELATSWAREELVSKGMVVQLALHHSKDGANPHVHLLCPLRRVDGENFAVKKAREWNEVTLLLEQRRSWADAVNAALEKAGSAQRVDHRSLKDQRIDRVPEPKIGVAAMAMERRGVVEVSENRKHARFIRTLNKVLPFLRSVEKTGEVKQTGMGNSWWERSLIFMTRAGETAREVTKDSWRWAFAPQQRSKQEQRDAPDLRGPPRSDPEFSR